MVIGTRYQNEIPNFIQSNCVYHTPIYINAGNIFHVTILDNGSFFLIKKKEIMGSYDLISVPNSNSEIPYVTSPRKLSSDDIQMFMPYRQIEGENDGIVLYYLIIVDSSLHVVRHQYPKSISFHSKINDVIDVRVLENNYVEIILKDPHLPIITNFKKEKRKSGKCDESVDFNFNTDLVFIDNKLDCLKNEIAIINSEKNEHYHKYQKYKSLVPDSLQTNDDCPLHKFGDVWQKFYNEKLVIGIPVLNTAIESGLTIEKLKVILSADNAAHDVSDIKLKYSTTIFKSKNYQDYTINLNKGNLNFPEFDILEWMKCENPTLLPEEVAIVTLTLDFETLNFGKFQCFISYDVEMAENVFKNFNKFIDVLEFPMLDMIEQERFLVKLTIDQLKIDLLAVILTSIEFTCQLSFVDKGNATLNTFLTDQLHYKTIEDLFLYGQYPNDQFEVQNSSTMCFNAGNSIVPRIYYNSSNPLLNFVVVRVIERTENCSVRVYAKSNHDILRFFKCVYEEFGRQCSISFLLEEDKKVVKEALEANILATIDHLESNVDKSNFKETATLFDFKTNVLKYKLDLV